MTAETNRMRDQVNTAMPASTVIPELAYADVNVAADWLCSTFGFTLRLRFDGHRAQLNFGDGAMVVVARVDDVATSDPTHAVMIRVLDVDEHYRRACDAGATILKAPESYPYGERQYSVADLDGHRWTFSQSIADFDPRDFGATVGVLTATAGPLR